MRSTRFLISAILVLTATKAVAREVEIVIDNDKPIRTIWVPPQEPKILIFPGDVSYCYNSTKFLMTATADALKLDENQNWVREIAIATNLAGVTAENVEDVASEEFILRCKFLGKDGNYISRRIPVRIDSYNRHKDEETYIFSETGKSLLDRSLKDRIKSYGQIEIRGDKLIIPTFAQEESKKTTPSDKPKNSPKPGEDVIKGFKPLTIGG